MKSPFLKVYHKRNGKEISNIESFNYEDSDDKDAYAEFRINGLAKNERNEYLMNDLELSKDTDLLFQFGFIGGFVSPINEITIHENKIEYNQGRAVVVLRCLDKGNVIKRIRTNKQWRNVTASQIATEIAKKYSMATTRIEPTERIYKSICQSGLSDFQLLHKLAHESGALNCFVSNNTLVFEKINFSKKSKRLLTVGDNVIRFSTTVSNSNSVGTAHKGVTASGIDTNSGEKFSYNYIFDAINNSLLGKFSTNEKPTKDKRISNGVVDDFLNLINIDNSKHFNPDANSKNVLNINSETTEKIMDIIGTVKIGATSPQDAKNKAEAMVAKAKKNAVTASLELELDSSFNIGDIVTIDGLIADRDKGNWYVKEIRHSIKPNAYASTSLELSRNATNAGTTPAKGELNKTLGDLFAGTTKAVRHVLNGETGEFITNENEIMVKKFLVEHGHNGVSELLKDKGL